MSQTVTVTGRVTGPDGLGRMGRIRFTPAALGAPLPAREIVAGRVSARIDPDGRLVTPTGGDLTIRPGNYEIDLTIPGDLGAHVRTTRYLSDGQTLDLSDLLGALPPTPPPPPPAPQPQPEPRPPQPQPQPDTPAPRRGVRSVDNATTLEAINGSEVIDLGNGVLTWR
jgi:hypothetical protein|nr:MAG TPA: YenB [Caudoviricetes sp.]